MSREIEQAIQLLSKLPALGHRSARRLLLTLLGQKETRLAPLINALQTVYDTIGECPVCGNMDTSSPCSICADENRTKKQICVVQDVADLWALERSGAFKGKYHVLGGLLSALNGIGPDELRIKSLIEKIDRDNVSEIILALPSTVDGQTTAHYLTDRLASIPPRHLDSNSRHFDQGDLSAVALAKGEGSGEEKTGNEKIRISSLSRGVPVGGELDYLDDGTLQMAMKSRREIS